MIRAIVLAAAAISMCSCAHKRELRDRAPCHSFSTSADGKAWVYQGNGDCSHEPAEILKGLTQDGANKSPSR